jgi:hypothetical protein
LFEEVSLETVARQSDGALGGRGSRHLVVGVSNGVEAVFYGGSLGRFGLQEFNDLIDFNETLLQNTDQSEQARWECETEREAERDIGREREREIQRECVCERDRERENQRERDTEREGETERHTERERERYRERQIEWDRETERDGREIRPDNHSRHIN